MTFDWTTLALQTVNLLVLVWLLRRFLFGPITSMISQRRMTADKMLADAETARQAAKDEVQRATEARVALAAAGDAIRTEALETAHAEHDALMQQAQDDIARARQAAKADAERDKAEQQRSLEADAHQLAISIASRLLGRLSGHQELQMPQTWLADLKEADLRGLAEPGQTAELVTPMALDPSAQMACVLALRQRIGADIDLRFLIDPSLIAGIELRGPHVRLSNNWRADLDRMAEELSQDDQHLAVA